MDRTLSRTQDLFRPEDLIGRTLGQHRIVEKIGEGGMGVVFKAVDTRLDRTVALKIINPQALAGEEARNRFIRETRAGAALNHPNICTLYGADEAEGVLFMSMEYVNGPSLRAKIDERPLPLAEALDIAIQAGEGLQAAHRKGIIHRDIKPGNILIDEAGRVKILDFGLANMLSLSQFTITGTVLGTPAYMSPEQLQAGRADERSDIWALGVVIYEMLSGRLPFSNQSGQGLAYQIVHQEPEPLTALRSGLPIEIDQIVAKAVAKDPARRYQHVDDLLVDLQTLKKRLPDLGRTTWTSAAPAPRTSRSWKKVLPWAVAGALPLIAVVAIWKPWRSAPAPADAQVVRFTVKLPEGDSFQGVGFGGSAVDLSPDGKEVVYAARRGKTEFLFRRSLADLQPAPVPDTQGAEAPILSRDMSWVTFASGKAVKRVHAQAGGSTVIRETPGSMKMFDVDIAYFGGCWISDNDLLVSECTRGLRLYSLDTEKKTSVSEVFRKPDEKELQHQFPQLLPGTRWVLFTIWNSPADSRIAVRSLETGEQKVIIAPGTYARYSPSGHIVYAWQGDLFAVRFDLRRLKVSGNPVKVVEGVMMYDLRGAAQFSLSENGSLAYISGPFIKSRNRLAWVDLKGTVENLDLPEPDRGVRLSPDGSMALAVRYPEPGSATEVWIYEFERGVARPLTDQKSQSYWSVFTPDGGRIVYMSSTDGLKSTPLYSVAADGSQAPELLVPTTDSWLMPYSWSPDGRSLAYQQGMGDTYDIWLLPLEGERKPRPLLNAPYSEIHPAISPDGRLLAYASNESGRFEVKVRPLEGSGAVVQVSSTGGWEPAWSPDGSVLYFRNIRGNRMMAASVRPGFPIRVGMPEQLFENNHLDGGYPFGRNYDVALDGRRFLTITYDPPPPPPTEYHVILNWAQELKRLVPGR